MKVKAELHVTKVEPPRAFAFAGKDLSGSFEHTFTVTPKDGGCVVERAVGFKTSPLFTVLFPIVYPLMGKRTDEKAMRQLKARLEGKA